MILQEKPLPSRGTLPHFQDLYILTVKYKLNQNTCWQVNKSGIHTSLATFS